MPRPTPILPSETLFRLRIVSAVDALIAQGHGAKDAVRLVAAKSDALGPDVHPVSPRTVERWRRAWRDQGAAGLQRESREAKEASRVLSATLLDTIRDLREEDPGASVPELIERARVAGALGPESPIDRTTVWRAMQRMQLDTTRSRKSPPDTRRFAYRERMQMVMADFKHFRAGSTRCKRLAVYLLDDATRFGLDVLVTTGGEDLVTVLHAVAQTMRRWGRFGVLYVDRGPGFRAEELAQVLSRLNIGLVLGTAGYPEGRGKIEAFNRGVKARLLRGLTADGVDPDPASLTLRLRHDLHEIYNHRAHAGLGGDSPASRWQDGRPLQPISEPALRDAFVVHEKRTVSADHVVSVDGVWYEMPLGFARKTVQIERHLLDDNSLHHPDWHGQLVRLAPVDVHANAVVRRAKQLPEATEDTEDTETAVPTAAMRRYAQQLGPITAADGGYSLPKSDTSSDAPHED